MAMMETIANDMKIAMKSGDKLRLETLRTLRAAFLEKQVEKRPSGLITPEDEIAVLNSALKKRKESSTIFRENGRIELAEQEEQEAEIIKAYLPAQLSQEAIEIAIKSV